MIWGFHSYPFSIYQVRLSQNGISGNFEFIRSFKQAKTIVDHRTRICGKPLKNHWCQWSICEKTFNGDHHWWSSGIKTIEKPSIAMVPSKKIITIPSLWKNYHRWSLSCSEKYFSGNCPLAIWQNHTCKRGTVSHFWIICCFSNSIRYLSSFFTWSIFVGRAGMFSYYISISSCSQNLYCLYPYL